MENPRLEARLLLAEATGRATADLIREPAAPANAQAYDDLLDRRARHEPLAYILGHREFWSLDFLVSRATLIPRPDSETIVEAALAACPAPRRVLDLGTGTGCLLLAVLSERPGAFGVGLDLSTDAVRLAAQNARRLRLADRAAFACGNWAEALNGRFDLVVSNPPYIETGAMEGLMADVAGYEPRLALDGGLDGLSSYRCIINVLPRILEQGGVAVLELGAAQADAVGTEAAAAGFLVEYRTDLAWVRRAIILRDAAT